MPNPVPTFEAASAPRPARSAGAQAPPSGARSPTSARVSVRHHFHPRRRWILRAPMIDLVDPACKHFCNRLQRLGGVAMVRSRNRSSRIHDPRQTSRSVDQLKPLHWIARSRRRAELAVDSEEGSTSSVCTAIGWARTRQALKQSQLGAVLPVRHQTTSRYLTSTMIR